MKKLVIYGTAYLDLIKLIDAINRATPTWEITGFLDDRKEVHGQLFMGYPVIGGRELIPDLIKDKSTYFFNNVSGHWSRSQLIAELLDSYDCKIPNLIHPGIDLNYVSIGRGCILPEGCVVGSNVKLGNFVTVRLKTLISHDVKVEDFTIIGPGVTIGSFSLLKKGCFIGAGATVMSKKTVGEYSLVGAGAVVTKDVSAKLTVAGVPAKPLIKKDDINEKANN